MKFNKFRDIYPELDTITAAQYCEYTTELELKYSLIKGCVSEDTFNLIKGLYIAHLHTLRQGGGEGMAGAKQSWKEGDVSIQYWNGGANMNPLFRTEYGTRLAPIIKALSFSTVVASTGHVCRWP